MSESIKTIAGINESYKPEFSVDKFCDSLKNTKTEILSAIKWSLSRQDRLPGIPDDERKISFIQGNLKGLITEKLSNFLGFEGAETVFKSDGYPISLDDLDVISPGDYIGCSNKKADIISTALKMSLDKKPLSIYGKSGDSASLRKIKSNIISDYESPPRNAPPGYNTLVGEVFQNTVIPDAFLVKKSETDGSSELLGLIEVKAYTADELAILISKIRNNEGSQDSGTRFKVKGTASEFGKKYLGADQVVFNMGFDINKEVDFVDFIRGVSEGDPGLYEQNIIVLRFPNDVPDNLLNQFGHMIVDYGYPNVVIQKLPLSNQEIDDISKKLVEGAFSDIQSRKLPINFSEKEISLLHKYILG